MGVGEEGTTSRYGAGLEARLPAVRDAIQRAAARSGRDAAEVRIIAVTKGHPLEALEAARDAGLHDVGENRVEELEGKVARLGRNALRWHMIGRLQRRKVPRLLACCDLLHSVGTLSLARRVSERWMEGDENEGETRSAEVSRPPALGGFPVLLQVNTSGEEAKGGFSHARAEEEIHEALELPGLHVKGLMTMAPWEADEALLRQTFRRLRELQDEVGANPGYRGRELSMGMSNDYSIAVEEGSTMIRLGTALFGERST